MAIPILLIAGALGAGKTTLINRLLSEPNGRRIAAVVNDFGAINIDAALLASVSDDVINLKNGCVCCSLLGDLLTTLSTILRRDPPPDGIVIETSGVSNPAEIVRTLLDPVIWREAALETVISVVDAEALADRPVVAEDGLWQAQVAAADFVALSKTDLVGPDETARARAAVRRHVPVHAIHDMVDGRLPPELLFAGEPGRARPVPGLAPGGPSHAFTTVSWTSDVPLAMGAFQAVIGRHGSALVRAKGFVTFAERPADRMLFQLVGRRATIGRAPVGRGQGLLTQLVFIARQGMLDETDLIASLETCRGDRNGMMAGERGAIGDG